MAHGSDRALFSTIDAEMIAQNSAIEPLEDWPGDRMTLVLKPKAPVFGFI